MTGLEPATTGATVQGSAIELHPPYNKVIRGVSFVALILKRAGGLSSFFRE